MIKSLALANWRNYEDVALSFDRGTTFVVASNGVGKTSLVEAARFALFGVLSTDAASPVRVGETVARSRIEIELPTGQVVTIERSLSASGRPSTPRTSIQMDGQSVDEAVFARAARETYGTEPAFLARLAMPAASRDQDAPTALGLEAHLGQYFGVDSLQTAIAKISAELKRTQKEIRQIKNANAATARQLQSLETDVADRREEAELAAARHASLDQARADRLAFAQARLAHESWVERNESWLEQGAELHAEIQTALQQTFERPEVSERLAVAAGEANTMLEQLRVRMAVIEARIDFITVNEAKLAESGDDCPVCRRALDESTISHAHQANQSDRDALAHELEGLHEEARAVEIKRDRLATLRRQWNRLPVPGPEPVLPDFHNAPTGETELGVELPAALDLLVASRAALVNAERRRAEARDADDAMKRLVRLFRQEATLTVALETTKATLADVLEQTVRPLAYEVNQRWTALFPTRGDLRTYATGNITRRVNGHDLPYEAFSTGEGIGATIVVRLLVAQMATTADFCWFDEPLEHLDPNVRRQVANILARASSGSGPLKQIVVTTYEEALARQLQARSPESVRLVDVRQSTTVR